MGRDKNLLPFGNLGNLGFAKLIEVGQFRAILGGILAIVGRVRRIELG